MKNILIVDTETGGLNPSVNGILSISLKLLNEEESLTIYFKPDPRFIYEAQALKINKLDLLQLKQQGLNFEDGSLIIHRWLLELQSKYNIKQFTLVGHNITFDIPFLKQIFEDDILFSPFKNKMFDYHTLDTCMIGNLLRFLNVISVENVKLITLYTYFGGKNDLCEAHTSHFDVLMTEYIFVEMLKLLNKNGNKYK
jgi:DNA polymerase III alpha subunit (gram-positive type)